jgi:hypothetical protein
MLILIWSLVLLALALWSLMGWGLYALLSMDQQWLGELKPLLDQVPFGHWLDQWVPGWEAMAALAIDAVQWVLGWLGAAAPVAVWMIWGGGTLILVGSGALLSLLVVLLRDKPRPAAA